MDEAPEITLEDMVAQLGGKPPSEEEPPVDEGSQNPPGEEEANIDVNANIDANTPPNEEEPPADTDPKPDAQQQQQQKKQPPEAKAREAFVYMRQQNKRMSDALKGVADVLGLEDINLDDENQLLEAVQQSVLAKQAEKQSIPVEFLQEFQNLKARDLQREAQQREQETAVGLQTIQTKYGLQQEELNAFVKELFDNGVNPLAQSVNLVQEYQKRHFEDIVAKEVSKAVAAEQQRASKAATHSSNPGNKTGANVGLGETGKVESVRDLEAWLKANNQI